MPKYVVPVQFVYEAHYFVEASDDMEAMTTIVSDPTNWLPKVVRGKEALFANVNVNWTSINVDTPVSLTPKAVASTTKPSRRRAK